MARRGEVTRPPSSPRSPLLRSKDYSPKRNSITTSESIFPKENTFDADGFYQKVEVALHDLTDEEDRVIKSVNAEQPITYATFRHSNSKNSTDELDDVESSLGLQLSRLLAVYYGKLQQLYADFHDKVAAVGCLEEAEFIKAESGLIKAWRDLFGTNHKSIYLDVERCRSSCLRKKKNAEVAEYTSSITDAESTSTVRSRSRARSKSKTPGELSRMLRKSDRESVASTDGTHDKSDSKRSDDLLTKRITTFLPWSKVEKHFSDLRKTFKAHIVLGSRTDFLSSISKPGSPLTIPGIDENIEHIREQIKTNNDIKSNVNELREDGVGYGIVMSGAELYYSDRDYIFLKMKKRLDGLLDIYLTLKDAHLEISAKKWYPSELFAKIDRYIESQKQWWLCVNTPELDYRRMVLDEIKSTYQACLNLAAINGLKPPMSARAVGWGVISASRKLQNFEKSSKHRFGDLKKVQSAQNAAGILKSKADAKRSPRPRTGSDTRDGVYEFGRELSQRHEKLLKARSSSQMYDKNPNYSKDGSKDWRERKAPASPRRFHHTRFVNAEKCAEFYQKQFCERGAKIEPFVAETATDDVENDSTISTPRPGPVVQRRSLLGSVWSGKGK